MRLKVHTVWKNSLLFNGTLFLKRIFKIIGKGIHQIYDRRKATTKMIILFSLFIISFSVLEAAIIFFHGIWKILFGACYLLLGIAVLWKLLEREIQNTKLAEGAERIADG